MVVTTDSGVPTGVLGALEASPDFVAASGVSL